MLQFAEEIMSPPHRFAFCLDSAGQTLLGVARTDTDGYASMIWIPAEIIHYDPTSANDTPDATFPFRDDTGQPMQPIEMRRIRF